MRYSESLKVCGDLRSVVEVECRMELKPIGRQAGSWHIQTLNPWWLGLRRFDICPLSATNFRLAGAKAGIGVSRNPIFVSYPPT
jgi:hypothetical protein